MLGNVVKHRLSCLIYYVNIIRLTLLLLKWMEVLYSSYRAERTTFSGSSHAGAGAIMITQHFSNGTRCDTLRDQGIDGVWYLKELVDAKKSVNSQFLFKHEP